MIPTRIAALLAAGLATVPTLVQAEALPFWSRPFPSGYTDGDTDCLVKRRIQTRHGVRLEWIDRCEPILHARG